MMSNTSATTNVLTLLNSTNLSSVLQTLQDYSLLLETIAKLYYDWTTFETVNAVMVQLSNALIANTNISLQAN